MIVAVLVECDLETGNTGVGYLERESGTPENEPFKTMVTDRADHLFFGRMLINAGDHEIGVAIDQLRSGTAALANQHAQSAAAKKNHIVVAGAADLPAASAASSALSRMKH